MRILYLDLDTLRPDHLGCYGYHRDTSPNIDSIAKQGMRFDNYYCSDAPCLPSRTAMMSGRFGIHTGVVNHGGLCADFRHEGRERNFRDKLDSESIPGMLRKAGMKTVSISPFAERHSSYSFLAGFSEVHNTGKGGMESAEEVTPTALDWITRNADQDNWFLQLNYWDPHTPYRAPEEFGNPFKDDPLPEWLTDDVVKGHMKMVGPHCAREISMYDNSTNPKYPRYPGEIRSRKDLRRMIDGYDCGIRYMDEHIGRLFKALKQKNVFDDLVIIISSDHGENLGELGIYGEHGTADNITCRIPMIIRWPGMKNGVDKGMHYNLDLGPTLAEILGREKCRSWDGQSYAQTLKSGKDSGREYLVISQCAHVCQRGVRFGEWLYIRTYHDGYHLFPKNMLFNLKKDPNEQFNLADKNPDKVKEGISYLNEWHDEMMMTMQCDTDPLWTVMKEGGPFHARGHLKKYCEYLKKTGRSWAIPELEKGHPREFQGL
ncbi:MAG TPA: sulfatase [Lentisphaeria bacterium]|nr:MAG: sulfatase [Lentisphaerae bacterium GWF2_50_93]HCE46235.1 sulfatase [Lentisphaeria bacterium]